jgi:hypothetical protein
MAKNAAAPMIWRISISFLMLFQSERLPDRATTVMCARAATAPSCSGFTIGQIGGMRASAMN